MKAVERQPLPPELAAIQSLEPRQALDVIVKEASRRKASDLFIQSNGNHYTVSVRQMGTIQQLVVVSTEQGMQLVNLVKSRSGMDVAERRHPLDGRWTHQLEDERYDFRINSMGTLQGEDLVLRLLPGGGACMPLDELGLVSKQFDELRGMLNRGSGLVLVTGPVGAGKSTTLYACIDYLNDGHRMIHTLEDPVEIIMPGVRQCQIQPKIGLGFSELLRGVLRQSPDVVMIGEIRDEETAKTAVRAANCGHLVLTTLHSPLAADAVQSMLAYGVNPFFLANSLVGIVAQRLIRTLSPSTRKMYDVSLSPETFSEVREYLEPGQGNVIYGPDEDDPDSQAGYIGQTGLFEVLTVNRQIKALIAGGGNAADIQQAALQQGMLDFSRAGLLKTAQGITGIEELGRTIPTVELDEYDTATAESS